MNPTIKGKNLRVPNLDYSPGLARFTFAVACIIELLIMKGWI